jgi:hypothetical protein
VSEGSAAFAVSGSLTRRGPATFMHASHRFLPPWSAAAGGTQGMHVATSWQAALLPRLVCWCAKDRTTASLGIHFPEALGRGADPAVEEETGVGLDGRHREGTMGVRVVVVPLRRVLLPASQQPRAAARAE